MPVECGIRLARGVAAIPIVVALAASASCRRSEDPPAVAGAARVVSAADVRLFVHTPVSTREFEDAGRRWTERVWPRFNGGRIHSFPGEDGVPVIAEAPPMMAFRNRGDDCGPASERRVCVLPWEKVEIAVCGRPLDGHLGIRGDRLSDSVIMACREIEPAKVVDGVHRNSERDCTRAGVAPLSKFAPEDLRFIVDGTAIVAGSAVQWDRSVCKTMPWNR